MELSFDPYDPSLFDHPWAAYAALRELAPVYFNEKYPFWALSRFGDVKDALGDHKTYCSSQGLLILSKSSNYDAPSFPPGNMLLMDPPQHTGYRTLVSRRFLQGGVGKLEARIKDTANALVDRFIEAGSADLVAQFAVALPAMIFGDILGIPPSDVEMFQRWSAQLVSPAPTPEAMQTHHDAVEEVSNYFGQLFAEKRSNPDDDLLSELAAGRVHNTLLNVEEFVGYAIAMLIAGNDTTSNFLANGSYLFAVHPDQRAQLVADPDLMANAVEEILRYEPPVHGMARTLTRDVDKHGAHMSEGQKVLLLFGSADRDEEVFADPDRFDITRRIDSHLSFGFGIHYCIGTHLGRLEGGIGLQTLLTRLGDYELETDEVHWRQLVPTRPMASLPVEFRPGPVTQSPH